MAFLFPGDAMNDAAGGEKKRPRGRPTIYTSKLADAICRRLATGESLRRICRDDGMPAESTVRAWALDDINGFNARYTRARNLGLDCMADEMLEIADDGRNDTYLDDNGKEKVDYDNVKRSTLRVTTRQWLLEKLASRKYGNKQELDVNGNLTLVGLRAKAKKEAANDGDA